MTLKKNDVWYTGETIYARVFELVKEIEKYRAEVPGCDYLRRGFPQWMLEDFTDIFKKIT